MTLPYPRLGPRARVAVPSAARLVLDGEVETATDAVEEISIDLGPAERADVALIVEDVVEKAHTRRGGSP